MSLKIEQGRYVCDPRGGLEAVSGTEELAQRLFFRLCARRGQFLPSPEFGSRLHKLHLVKPSGRDAAIKQFVAEAIASEKDVTLLSHSLIETEAGVFRLGLTFSCGSESFAFEMKL